MFCIFKKLKEQREEIELLRLKLYAANKTCDVYAGWRNGYMWSICEMVRTGELTAEQVDQIFDGARLYYDKWREHLNN